MQSLLEERPLVRLVTHSVIFWLKNGPIWQKMDVEEDKGKFAKLTLITFG